MTTRKPYPSRSLFPLAFLIVASALFLEAARAFTTEIGSDQAWYLLLAERFLHGAQLYGPQMSETNPPLIIWFSTLALGLAHLLHCNPAVALMLLLAFCMAACALWCFQLMRRSPLHLSLPSAGLFALVLMVVELWSGSTGFAQREQFFFVLAFPYFLYVAMGAGPLSRTERIALGITAGFAVCLKPQETLVIVLLELVTAIATRSLRRVPRAELLALVLTCVAYVAAVRLVAPLFFTDTFSRLTSTYWAFADATPLAVGLRLGTVFLQFGLLAVAALLLAQRKHLGDARVIASIFFCAVGALLAYMQQRTYWQYHFQPGRFFLRIGFAWLGCRALVWLFEPNRLKRSLLVPVAALLAILLPAVDAEAVREALKRHRSVTPTPLDAFMSGYQPGTTLYVLSTDPFVVEKAFVWHIRWGSRFAHLWMLPAIVKNEKASGMEKPPFLKLSPDTVHKLTFDQQTASTEDLARWKPKAILVQRCTAENSCEGLTGWNFDILAWFLRNPDFAQEWQQHYKPASGAPAGYDLYARVD